MSVISPNGVNFRKSKSLKYFTSPLPVWERSRLYPNKRANRVPIASRDFIILEKWKTIFGHQGPLQILIYSGIQGSWVRLLDQYSCMAQCIIYRYNPKCDRKKCTVHGSNSRLKVFVSAILGTPCQCKFKVPGTSTNRFRKYLFNATTCFLFAIPRHCHTNPLLIFSP